MGGDSTGIASSIGVFVPLISAFLGGSVVALLNYVLNKPATKASIAKMIAETEATKIGMAKIVAETEKVRAETQIISSKVSDT